MQEQTISVRSALEKTLAHMTINDELIAAEDELKTIEEERRKWINYTGKYSIRNENNTVITPIEWDDKTREVIWGYRGAPIRKATKVKLMSGYAKTNSNRYLNTQEIINIVKKHERILYLEKRRRVVTRKRNGLVVDKRKLTGGE